MLNDEFVAGLIGLVPVHLPRSHSLQYAHAWSAVDAVFKTNISQGSVATPLGAVMGSVMIVFLQISC